MMETKGTPSISEFQSTLMELIDQEDLFQLHHYKSCNAYIITMKCPNAYKVRVAQSQ